MIGELVMAALSLFPPLGMQVKPDVSPHRVDNVIANGVRLSYLDWGGKGEAIIFLAGSGDTPHAFDELAPKFTNQYRVLGLTRRGFGASQRNVTDFDAVTLAKDLASFMDMRGIQKAHLVGHSAAGDELTQFATDYTDRVLKLVYLDAAYNRSSILEMEKLNPIPDIPPTNLRLKAHYDAIDAYRPNFRAVRAPILSIYSIFESHWAIDEKTSPELRERANAFVKDIVQPYQWGNIRGLKRAAPHAEVEVLRGTDHNFFEGKKFADWTFKRIARFLKKRDEKSDWCCPRL
ncbi:MAG TPA: alpha/beta hydrolase [Fimbriimonas sp.]|nr:alpha/beta hydrolase [Fimbriimonas sp.]